MATKLTPLGDRLIAKPKKGSDTTAFGMVFSDANREKPMEAEVICISENASGITVGDTVMFKKYSPVEIKDDNGDDLYIIDIYDVIAIVASSDDATIIK